MNLSIPQLESILASFPNETNKSILIENDQILNQWKDDLNTLPVALEIIQKSENMSLLIFSIIKIKYNLQKNSKELNEDHLNSILGVCVDRIFSNRVTHNIPQNILLALFEIISFTTFLCPQLFPIIVSSIQFTPDELVSFFSNLLNEINIQSNMAVLPEPQAELKSVIITHISKIFELLQQLAGSDISFSWILLHCTLNAYVQSYSDLLIFLPYVEIALTNEAYVPTILDFFGEVITSPQQEDFQYLKELINIMIKYAISIFSDPTDEKVYTASFIWGNIIDKGLTFFGDPFVGPEFTNTVFLNFFQSLPLFIHYDLKDDFEEFYTLLDFFSACLKDQPPDLPLSYFTDYISMCLDLIINEIDFVSNLEMPREDRLFPNCIFGPKLDKCLMQIMLSDSESENYYSVKEKKKFSEFNQFLSFYFNMKIENLTNGFLYVFSFAPKKTRKIFASRIGLIINEIPQKMVASIYFIAQCCQFTPEFSKQQVDLAFFISTLQYAPLYEVSEALANLSVNYAEFFIDPNLNYISTIQGMIEISPISVVLTNLFIAIFNIFNYLEIEYSNSNQQQMIQTINDIFEKFHALFVTKIPFQIPLNDTLNLMQFNDLVIPIIEYSQNKDNRMTIYYSRLFSHIEEVIKSYIFTIDPEFQKELCPLIEMAFKKHWIVNKEPYFRWIEQILGQCPIPLHLSILSFLIEFLPTPPITEFLAGLQNFSEQMVNKYILFLIEVMKVNPPLLTNLVVLKQILYPLNFTDVRILNNELSLLIYFTRSPLIQITAESADQIAQLIAQKIFASDFVADSTISYAVILMKVIGSKFNLLSNTLQYILTAVGVQIQQVEKFANSYMQDDHENFKLGINDLIEVIMKKNGMLI